MEENQRIADSAAVGIMTKDDEAVIDSVIKAFNDSYKIPCTGCNYCMPCPFKVNIPGCFAAYNMSYAVGRMAGLTQYITSTGALDLSKNYVASQCKKCGKCEKHCPQHISIVDSLANVKRRMEPFWFKAALNLFVKFRERK